MARYGVARNFRLKSEAVKWAKAQREACYGATVHRVADGWMVRRSDRLVLGSKHEPTFLGGKG